MARKPKNAKNTQKTANAKTKNKQQVKRPKQKHDPSKWEKKKAQKHGY